MKYFGGSWIANVYANSGFYEYRYNLHATFLLQPLNVTQAFPVISWRKIVSFHRIFRAAFANTIRLFVCSIYSLSTESIASRHFTFSRLSLDRYIVTVTSNLRNWIYESKYDLLNNI